MTRRMETPMSGSPPLTLRVLWLPCSARRAVAGLQSIEEGFELRGDLGPGVDGDVAGGAVGDAAAEGWVVGEAQDQGRVVAVLREEGVLAVLEEVVGLAVVGENGLFPAQVFLELGVAVLVGSALRLRP